MCFKYYEQCLHPLQDPIFSLLQTLVYFQILSLFELCKLWSIFELCMYAANMYFYTRLSCVKLIRVKHKIVTWVWRFKTRAVSIKKYKNSVHLSELIRSPFMFFLPMNFNLTLALRQYTVREKKKKKHLDLLSCANRRHRSVR